MLPSIKILETLGPGYGKNVLISEKINTNQI